MTKYNIDDTIAAIATSVGDSGIGIVRISGSKALLIADRIFISRDNKKPSGFGTYTVHYGWISDNSEIVDEVLLTVMRAPKSYTREDVVEINCHGGIVALRDVLDLVLENGCRLAEPGEFTKRAFLNGRIDLAQAEAVLDIIRAKTDSALKMGVEQLKGAVSVQVNKIRNDLLDILTQIEAGIDFPEEELNTESLRKIAGRLKSTDDEIKNMLGESKRARIFKEGIRAVICGRPNVGKSSLLNALLKRERCIVTPVAGTTRDIVEEVIDIKGIPVCIADTAGLLEPRDLVEKKAVQRSRKCIELADLVIFLFDGSKRLTKEDELLMKRLSRKNVIAVINKIDLKQKIDKDKISGQFSNTIGISAKKLKNINLLEEAIANLVYKGKTYASESVLVSNLRHIEALSHAQKVIAEAVNSLDNNNLLSPEFIAQDIKEALGFLDRISGKEFAGDLLDSIFSKFCIGK